MLSVHVFQTQSISQPEQHNDRETVLKYTPFRVYETARLSLLPCTVNFSVFETTVYLTVTVRLPRGCVTTPKTVREILTPSVAKYNNF